MEFKKLSAETLEDWLNFFDNIAFADNHEWCGCYCMCYHWNDELNRKRNWNCSKADAPFNRQCAIEFITSGKMQGYMAYDNGEVVGWCNTNDKNAYDNVNFKLPYSNYDKTHRVKCITCFCISPNSRGKGIATQMLNTICVDAKADGYDCIEAYPFHYDENHAYHGPKSMYEKNGFVKSKKLDEVTVYRKKLQ